MNVVVVDIALPPELLGRERFLLQTGWADELVAPQAALARIRRPHHAKYVEDLSIVADLDLGADLHGGDEVLVHDRVDYEPGLGRVDAGIIGRIGGAVFQEKSWLAIVVALVIAAVGMSALEGVRARRARREPVSEHANS